MGGDVEVREPRRGTCPETKGDDYAIGRYHFLGAGHRFRVLSAALIRRAEPGFDQPYAFDPAAADDLDRLAVEREHDAFFPGVRDFAARPRHVFLIAAVHAGDRLGLLTHRGAHAVHRGVAAAEHHNASSRNVGQIGRCGVRRVRGISHATIDV